MSSTSGTNRERGVATRRSVRASARYLIARLCQTACLDGVVVLLTCPSQGGGRISVESSRVVVEWESWYSRGVVSGIKWKLG